MRYAHSKSETRKCSMNSIDSYLLIYDSFDTLMEDIISPSLVWVVREFRNYF